MRRVAAVLLALAGLAGGASRASAAIPDVSLFFEAASVDEPTARAAMAAIMTAGWRDGYAALVLDAARFLPRPRAAGEREVTLPTTRDDEDASDTTHGGFLEGQSGGAVGPKAKARERLLQFLEKQTGQKFGQDLRSWRKWLWQRVDEPHPQYAEFKARLYGAVDPRMAALFPPGVKSTIRLDEIDWGGVPVNGIPALDHPKVVPGKEAAYMGDKNIVFGIVVNGEARAYPKRVLGWHELLRDRVGGEELTVVYCTLCGTVIPYSSDVGGRRFSFGTSGLLYRSNKLMFDGETGSLWSATHGKPVVGSLADSGLELATFPVVTTSWREWATAHPATTVLSLETGHTRDYSEGAAYRDYFSSDKLMFEVPKADARLKNKAEVLALLLRPAGSPRGTPRRSLAVSSEFLKKNPVHSLAFAGQDLVVLTTPEGANRVYTSVGTRFVRVATDGSHIIDDRGQPWEMTEEALLPEGRDEAAKRRIAARRAFWFGWVAQFPDTELVQ